MTTEQQQEQASLYVVGALSEGELRAFENELRANAELRELVRSLQRVTGLVAMAAPQIAPPAELKNKVLQRIESHTHGRPQASEAPGKRLSATPALATGFLFHAANDPTGWKALPVRGAWIKLLSFEKNHNYAVLLGKLEAGVRYPAHTHPGAEDLFILSGDLHIGDLALGPGDFHHSDPGTSHAMNYSVEGCTLLAVLSTDHELVRLAMA